MSTQRGNASRTRAQKYKNRHVFKNDLYDKTDQQKRLNALHISEVCQHCKSVIEWKIKYKKYKPLTQKKTCTRCQQRNITKAYHVLCRGCALDARVCAKCMKSAEEVDIEPAQPTAEEELKLKVEMERLIKSLPERKRRAFLRYMEKGKKEEEEKAKLEGEHEEEEKNDGVEGQMEKQIRVPYSRDELLEKIEQLKLNGDDDEDDEDGDDSDDYDDQDELNSESEDCEDSEEEKKGVKNKPTKRS